MEASTTRAHSPALTTVDDDPGLRKPRLESMPAILGADARMPT
jgi:electron transfer flavoprotein alpha/beta subunit